ncbi:MAG TPA: DUF4398 domain-containing protein [Polyangiaceae bacterium]|jgi:hypothetical protein
MRKLLGQLLVPGLLAVLGAGGCGGVHYAIAVNSASSRVEEAKAVGAEQLAPYEYYYAKEHLEQAQVEASEASYSDAANLADEAEEYANKAIELAQSARRTRP